MKRNSVTIFVVFSKNERLDDYIFYLAKEMKNITRTLVVTVNGDVNKEDYEKLKIYSNKIFVRKNIGYDSGAYKETLECFLGWDFFDSYQEIILMNDSCYGPIYPMNKMFKEMDNKNFDFWGITEQKPIKSSDYSNTLLPYHIQTYFIVVSEIIFKDEKFREFWKHLKLSNEYNATVHNFELRFTKYLNDLGYKSGAYVNSDKFCISENETQAYVFFNSYRLIAEEKCPLLKKKVFSFPHDIVLASNQGETAYRTLQYIADNTEYDVKYIYKDLIKNININDLKVALHLDFCLSQEVTQSKQKSKIVLVYFYNYDENRTVFDEYCKSVDFDLLVVCRAVDYRKLKEHYSSLLCVKNIIDYENKFEDFWESISKYEYVGFVGEEREFNTQLLNFMPTKEYVNNVILTFENNPLLGLLCLPYEDKCKEHCEYEKMNIEAEKLSKNIGIDITIDIRKKGYSFSNLIWFRRQALDLYEKNELFYRKLIDINCGRNINEKKILPILYPYIAQKNGFYSGRVMTNEYASKQITYFHRKLGLLAREIHLCRGVQEFKNIHKVNKRLIDFCKQFKKVYVYGAGLIGNECCIYLKMNGIQIESFLVSDGRKKDSKVNGIKVKEISDVVLDNACIVLAVNKNNIVEIKKVLNNLKIEDVILYED